MKTTLIIATLIIGLILFTFAFKAAVLSTGAVALAAVSTLIKG